MMRAATDRELRQLTQSCARILLDKGICGSGYLVDKDILATCRHVVANLAIGDVVECEFVTRGRERMKAVVVRFDTVDDVALLKLQQHPPKQARPLALARPVLHRDFECYGFPSFARGNPVHFGGTIELTNHPKPDFGRRVPDQRTSTLPATATATAAAAATAPVAASPPSPALPNASASRDDREAVPEETEVEISSPNLAGLQPSEEGLGGFSGSPVFAGGAVVAHLYRVLSSGDFPRQATLATVYAVPADRILNLLCQGRTWRDRVRLRAKAPLQRLRRRAWMVAPLVLLAGTAAATAKGVADYLMKQNATSTLKKAFTIEPWPVPTTQKQKDYDAVVDLARYRRRVVAPILAQLHVESQDELENGNTDAWAAAERALGKITEDDPKACDDLLGLLNLEGSDAIYSFEAQKMLLTKEGEALRRCAGARQRLCRYLGLLDGGRLGWSPIAVSQVCEGAKAVLSKYGPGSPSCGGPQCAL